MTAIAATEARKTLFGHIKRVNDDHTSEDYDYWQTQDQETLKRANALITDAQRDPFGGIGKPKPLQHVLSGAWSRRIDNMNRLVYYVTDESITILHAREHYNVRWDAENDRLWHTATPTENHHEPPATGP